MDILFLGFKNRASFLFIKPIFNSLKVTNEELSINIFASPKYLYELLNNDQICMELEKILNKKKLLIYVINPIFEIKNIFITMKDNLNNPKKFIVYTVSKSRLFFHNLFYFYKFFYLSKIKDIKYKIKYPSTFFKEKNFKLILLTGTYHHSSKEILFNLSKSIKNNSKIIWLPHAPHHGSLKNDFPIILNKFNCKVDVWLPSEKEFISNNSKNFSIFNSGYPPFDKSNLKKERDLIIKNKNKYSIILLLRQFKKESEPQNYFVSENEILDCFKLSKKFLNKNKNSNLIICPHPSINISRLKFLIKLSGLENFKIGRNYFLNYANQNSLVIGSYSTVLLHSALLGLKTICFDDSIIKYLKNKEPYFYSLYVNFPLICINPNLEEFKKAFSQFHKDHFYEYKNDKRFYNSPIDKFYRFSLNSIDRCKERIFDI